MLRLVETAPDMVDADLSRGPVRPTMAVLYERPVAAAGLLSVVSGHFAIIGRYTDAQFLIDAAGQPAPEVLAIEIGASITLGAVRKIILALPETNIVLWVENVSSEFVSHCLALGVRGILSKRGSAESHIECLTKAARGEVWIDHSIEVSLAAGKHIHLTVRERQVMSLLARGLANKAIAWELGISPGTVKVYLSKLFDKVGVGDRLELALMALRNIAPNEGRANLEQLSSPARWVPPTIVNMPYARVA